MINRQMPEPGLYPFWFWNGVQEETEIGRQLKLMKDAGCKGVAIHSRTGNKIEYLSERWLELVRFSCERAAELGLKIWLYDEDGYPSGNAGGKVQKLRPDLVQKYLSFEYSVTNPEQPAYAAFDADTYKRIDEKEFPAGKAALRFQIKTVNNHVDTLNPDAAKLFIEFTHEKYAKELKEFFGNTIELVYTDDESFQVCWVSGIVWSEVLEKEYAARYGSDMKELLPLLVEDLPGHEAARRNYFKLAQELFLKNFIEPQIEWSKKHGLVYTGHLCGDEGPRRFSIERYASITPYLMLEDIPALDDFLCDMTDHGYLRRIYSDPKTRLLAASDRKLAPLVTYKYASSVAHQFKKDLFSVEVLTFLFWKCKVDYLDLQMLFELGMGVNLMTPHAFYYTVGDGTRNDCPPSYFFQQPYYPLFGTLIQKWTRIAKLLLRGKYHADVLLISPANELALQNGTEFNPKFERKVKSKSISLSEMDEKFSGTVLELSRRHIGFDIGDEYVMGEKAVLEEARIRLGDMSYGTVVLSSGLELLPSTSALLESFRAAGGRLVFPDALASLAPDIDLKGEGTEEILVHARDNNGFRELYMLNLSGRDLKPEFECNSSFCIYDPLIDKIVFSGTKLPKDFTLREGTAFMVLASGFQAEELPFEQSIFAKASEEAEATLKKIAPNDDNIFAIQKAKTFELNIPDNAVIKKVYSEKLFESGIKINGNVPVLKMAPHHPADPCYKGADASGFFHRGTNQVTFEKEPDIFYLAGEFQVMKGENGYFITEGKLGCGDLARQGYPFYWGSFDYEFVFEGKPRFLKLEIDGAAEVFINGKNAGTILGKPYMLPIFAACSVGKNSMRIVLRNIAQNFICAEEPSSFGIYKALLLK
ncbi:MAG: hypothetical protein A2X49_08620 [Lentisphaerae bacterium GWF2_52_8]|nr:MAG: hypothetical protein A2X49_08620 [Lentisphaerae bacterium GWF2_52_8]